ncbi:MAG: 2-oxo acid dehydrogenase subunit E2, partial [Chloroflexi bacterium]|nr:2-oxo acid dehydrogenase subunit E2 [Chloroflexota bacterium]
MAEYIKMPTLGFDMEEGTMGTWLKQVGDTVSKGDVLAEIESDKVTQELTARADGVLLSQLANTGDLIPVGDNLGIIGAVEEDISAMMAQAGGNGEAAAPAPEATAVPQSPQAAAPVAKAAPTPAASDQLNGEFPDGVKATPVARRLAAEHGVNLARVAGSGPGNRVRKADVEAFIANPPAAETVVETAVSPQPPTTTSTEKPLTRMRQAIARRMAESKVTIPHFYITTDIDMAKAFDLRKQINASLPPEDKVSVNDLIVKAAALALRGFPNINASFAGDKIILHEEINVGSAVAVEGGLLTIVQKNTD